MKIKHLAAALLAFACAEGASVQPERPDIPLKNGAVVEKARITGIDHDKIIVISKGVAITIDRSSIADSFSNSLTWPEKRVEPPASTEKLIKSSEPVSPAVTQPQFKTPSFPSPPEEKEDLSPLIPFESDQSGPARRIHGQCFVVTRGGSNYKLGDVKISVLGKSEYFHYLSQVNERAEKFNGAWHAYFDACRDRKHLSGMSLAIERMKSYKESLAALVSGKHFAYTDADGKFDMEISIAGEFFVVANAKRLVGRDTEEYEWRVKSTDIPEGGQVMLSNRNMR